MKASNLVKVAALGLMFVMGAAAAALADPQNEKYTYKYVSVTGSMIPQKVKVKAIGTKTISPVRVYDRHEIDQTGRFTTEGVLSTDPSVRIIAPGGPGG
jgi:outer membrane cobalamin receptor